MSKFVAFFVSLGLFSAPVALAKSENGTPAEPSPQEEKQTEVLDEKFEKLFLEAGMTAFRTVKAANKECVSSAVSGKTLTAIIPMALASGIGFALGKRDELKASQKFIDSIIQSEMHSANKIYELGKAGSKTPQAQRFPRGKTSKFFTKVGTTILIAYAVEQVYYWTTGKDFFSSTSGYEFLNWLRAKLSRPPEGKELAEYYATNEGFRQFLQLNNEEEIKNLMKANPVLGAGTIAISQLVQAAGCTAIPYLAPNQLDEESRKLLTNPQHTKGESL